MVLIVYASQRPVQIIAVAAIVMILTLLPDRNHSITSNEVTISKISTNSFLEYSSRVEAPVHSTHPSASNTIQHGTSKPKGTQNSRIVVLPCMNAVEVSWIKEELPEVDLAIYVANDSAASLYPPKNKGHEVMIYLTYIIDNYANLPDIILFMHAHRWTHHNNDLLDNDAVQMISRLNDEHVFREGYVNMRCQWDPGCPKWLHPTNLQESLGKQEEVVLARCWGELFPFDPLPAFLAQTCCAQFAISKERILSIPLSQFLFYRNWILMTPLSDYISGRIWEYSWQFIFTRRYVNCPAEHICYCDGFKVCFGGEAQYKDALELRNKTRLLQSKLEDLKNREDSLNAIFDEVVDDHTTDIVSGQVSYLNDQIGALEKEFSSRKADALERGEDGRNRAKECGRT